jgi:hypothetical protein
LEGEKMKYFGIKFNCFGTEEFSGAKELVQFLVPA